MRTVLLPRLPCPWIACAFLALVPACGGGAEPGADAPDAGLPDPSQASGAPAARARNLLLISLDTLRADRLSCYGYERETSPNLDRLAAAGVRFAEALAPSVHTAPSHMSILTGLDPLAHGIANIGADGELSELHPDVPTLAGALRAAGWQTAAFTDRGNIAPQMGFKRDFDVYTAATEHVISKLERMQGFLAERDPEAPLFTFFHTYATHSPYLPDHAQHGSFADPSYEGRFAERLQLAARSRDKRMRGKPLELAVSFLEPWEGMTDADRTYLSDLYDECILSVDSAIPRLLKTWDREVGLDDTLVVVLSDHGEAFGEHGLRGHHGTLHRELLHVPLLMVGPGLTPRVVKTPVSLTGITPTLLDYFDLAPLDAMEPSFLPLLLHGEGRLRPLFSQRIQQTSAEFDDSVFDGGEKLLRRGGEGSELFDTLEDPGEERDLAAARQAEAERLEALLDRRRAEALRRRALHPPLGRGFADAALLEELQRLGYLGDD